MRRSILGICTDLGTESGIGELPQIDMPKYMVSLKASCAHLAASEKVKPRLSLDRDSGASEASADLLGSVLDLESPLFAQEGPLLSIRGQNSIWGIRRCREFQ